jgi:acetylornithine/succinyldiaminopimelate/putrescine aminotransferase
MALAASASNDALPSVFAHLVEMRNSAGQRITHGLSDKYLARFAKDPRLVEAIEKAYSVWSQLDADTTYRMPEQACIDHAFARFQHLYPESTRQPYMPIASKGPWMVSMHGAVVHDSGGYGMLGFGHNPTHILNAMGQEQVMANHMTPSLSHATFTDALRNEIGRSRDECPFESFICLNSGSEANEMVLRLVDMHAGRAANGRKVHNLVVEGSFHGRTLAASFLTDTTADAYRTNKARVVTQMQELNYTLTCPPNDIETLHHWFERCKNENCWIQCVYLEGVMGEGNPGLALSPEFYMAARELTWKYDAALCIDSIQAGMRTTGNLSICDYPGFEKLPPPDFETYSKALNAGQFPLSVVALNPRGASWYRHGIYGNTMTGNPRACEVATAVLGSMTPELRQNIRDMGAYFVDRYSALMDEIPEIIRVNGTGLLFQVKIDEQIPVTAMDGIERILRLRGINVIHGGTNALRFTPNFDITREEADMQIEHVRDVILEKRAALEPKSKL